MTTIQDKSDEQLRAEAERLEVRAQELEDQADDLRDEAAALSGLAEDLIREAEDIQEELERREDEALREGLRVTMHRGFGDPWEEAFFPQTPLNPFGIRQDPVAMEIGGDQWVSNGHVLVRPLSRVGLGQAPESWIPGMQRLVALMEDSTPSESSERGEKTTKIDGATYANRYVDLLTHLSDEPLRTVNVDREDEKQIALVAFRGGKPAGLVMPMKTWEDDR